MGTVYMIVGAGLFMLETVLQLCVVGTHSKGSEALFVVLLAIVMGPLILINFVSAIQVTRTQDFTGKSFGRAICIVFHSFQLGTVWRALKLLILFDHKDWLDYLNMRLFHTGFQSLPFSIVLSCSILINETKAALDIVTIVVTLISASISLTIYRTGNVLYDAGDTENRPFSIKKHVCIVFLSLSTFSVLLSRYASIVLFAVVQPLWIILPLSLHYFINLCIEVCKFKCYEDNTLYKVAIAVYKSFVNMFDMVGRDYTGVKCSYVLFYSLILIENLVFSSYWMLTSSFDERFKLLAVLMILMCFIVGLIVKFASCGCIFNIESDILSDAFNNPELKDELKDKFDKATTNTVDQSDTVFHEIRPEESGQGPGISVISRSVETPGTRSKHSKQGSSSTSSNSRLREYDNHAFVTSQGNISLHSQMTLNSTKRSQGSDNKHSSDGADISCEFRTLSGSSQDRSYSSKNRSRGSREPSAGSTKRSRGKGPSKSKHKLPTDVADPYSTVDSRKLPLKPKIIVSDTSKHATMQQLQTPTPRHLAKINNADLASSNSRYSRNTNTLNGSFQHYNYNGFDDPYREKKLLNKQRTHSRSNNYHQQNHRHRHIHHKYQPNMDYSLDSSELYPYMTSDTSSMSSYTDTNERNWRKQRQRIRNKCRHFESRDGYSTDVSNSDYLSFNDYSMEDSSSWTGSSSSSSDGAATWPPSHTANLLKMYNIPDKNSSTENIMHWLDTMDMEGSGHETSFSTLHEPSIASDTDISLSAMQTFEVKKEKKKFKRLMSKPKGLFLKFSSLNYKGKEKSHHNRPYPLKRETGLDDRLTNTAYKDTQVEQVSMAQCNNGTVALPTMPLPVDSVQESIV
ncbi:uncharacterized protein LOC132725320 [Ruditapes philippinarum]|uniref:uncharacterized protein LOC132725320 n=1 Tax=Ruditapes philippinarum TaxID=129788 RepID=UPI00295AC2FD|nr:uncharacterized protein LOC132725320 [Ruditapes philippinarum]XP_060566410.1 uncharacterized protein LOC132725320 [Ruditapes philippinarum]XP_060566411.1 uncharacterized protein LOC132725320 [Ruditapes philippinarum]XP_060566412.1 uncharacterized protein LOC132725320 [Ruditapes philippinarum]